MRFTTRDYHQGREAGCSACQQDFVDCRCDRYCHECGCVTNHSTQQHLEAIQEEEETEA